MCWQNRSVAVSWEEVVTIGTALPEVDESTSYNTPALKVAGKLLARLRTEDDGGLALRCSAADKESLVAGNDPAFYTTPHYDGHGYVLVDLTVVDVAELEELVVEAWLIVAPDRLRESYDT